MKNFPRFRPLEEWKTALMLLPDQSFFELMRSAFGNIKTPFSKQRLIEDLFAFLSRGGIQNTIAAYIDENDHKLIAATGLFTAPSLEELENFLSGEFSGGGFRAALRNLEERLILYRFSGGEKRRVALNPALENVLAPFAADTSPLFPSIQADGEKNGAAFPNPKAFLPDSREMAALFAFIEAEKSFFKSEGGIRKKILDEGKRLFPDIELELAAAILVTLGLFYTEGDALLPERKRIRDFCVLSPREKQEYWAAALYLRLAPGGNSGDILGYSALKERAAFIHSFIERLDPSKLYPKTTLVRRALLLSAAETKKEAWGRRLFGEAPELITGPFLESLEKCGLAVICENYYRITRPAGSSAKNEKGAVIAMDSAFSFILYPGIDFADALTLASFCLLKSGGGFELSRASAVRSFDRGMTSDGIVEFLKRLSGGRIDGNLEWTLKDWESRYASVSLHSGEVLVLAEDRRYLAEAKPLASLIQKTLAPGVYLMLSNSGDEIARALRKAGVDIFSQSGAVPVNEEGKNKTEKYRVNFFPPFHTKKEEAEEKNFEAPEPPKKRETALDLKERFKLRLKDLNLSDMERKELALRIERRLILTEAQLEGASLKYEKLEARGLDYAGKTVLAKQAIAAGSVLEVSWPEGGGGIKTVAGIPEAIEKKESENFLVLKPFGEEESELRLPLRKISRLSRIKQSIFEE